MAETNADPSVLFEHHFWLQILGDHARFIFDALSPKEDKEVERALWFMRAFDRLLEDARSAETPVQVTALNLRAQRYAARIRAFKLHLLRRHLLEEIAMSLPPTFLNHMVNEVEEYLTILNEVVNGKSVPVFHPLHHHTLWLADAAGHSATIAGLLDPSEKPVIEKSHQFTHRFEGFYLKALELAGYLRTQAQEFPALRRFSNEVNLELRLFERFLREVEELELEEMLLGSLSVLMPDHMAREECYYLMKLAQTGDIPAPECDPTRPRSQE